MKDIKCVDALNGPHYRNKRLCERRSHFVNMHYILLTEFESSRDITCRIMNLPLSDIVLLEKYFHNIQIETRSQHDLHSLEVDVQGAQLLTKLSDMHYKLIGQSMTIEHTVIGGSTVKTQKIVWTLGKE